MYSEHGFDALMRSVAGHVCQALIVVSNCTPGSPHSHAASVTFDMRSRARIVSSALPSVRAVRAHSRSSRKARMNASVTRIEWFAFWKKIES